MFLSGTFGGYIYHGVMAIGSRLTRFFFKLARRPFFGRLAGVLLANGAGRFLFRRLAETERLLVVAHPRPCYPFHALALPKTAVRDFESLTAAERRAFARDLAAILPELFERRGADWLRLVINGGSRQDVAQLHVHLIDDAGVAWDGLALETSGSLADDFAAASEILAETGSREGYSLQFRMAAACPAVPVEGRLQIDRRDRGNGAA